MTDKIKILNDSEQQLFAELVELIDTSQKQVAINVNSGLIIIFWQVGKKINNFILDNKRAEYGKQIVVTLSRQLSWSHFLTYSRYNHLKSNNIIQFKLHHNLGA